VRAPGGDEPAGPLVGVRIVEIAGLGALPYGVLRLADMGADVVRVERPSAVPAADPKDPPSFWDRGRRSIAVDLKDPEGVEVVLRLAERAEILVESFRPGVMERLGLGPAAVLARSPGLVYGRLSGWGQDGPLARAAGHSLNYEAITGLVHAVGPRGGAPVPVLQVLGDFAGGGLQLAFGVVCALLEARRSGRGQVVDVAMSDGVIALAATYYSMHAMGMHTDDRGTNLFDGGAPFYGIYETSDGRFVSVAAIEARFWRQLLERLDVDPGSLPDQWDRDAWPAMRARLAAVFRTRTRDAWCAALEGTDACVAPVLTFGEARTHPHNVARGVFDDDARVPGVRPTPRLERTPGRPRPPSRPGADTNALLGELGYAGDAVAALRARGVVA
jgi:alpha-methylacyl-CoA racemase